MREYRGYTIFGVSGCSALSPNAIRALEHRCRVVAPERRDTTRRLHDDSEIDQLRLLCLATDIRQAGAILLGGLVQSRDLLTFQLVSP